FDHSVQSKEIATRTRFQKHSISDAGPPDRIRIEFEILAWRIVNDGASNPFCPCGAVKVIERNASPLLISQRVEGSFRTYTHHNARIQLDPADTSQTNGFGKATESGRSRVQPTKVA